jgi:hypothetical protein
MSGTSVIFREDRGATAAPDAMDAFIAATPESHPSNSRILRFDPTCKTGTGSNFAAFAKFVAVPLLPSLEPYAFEISAADHSHRA